MNVKYSNSLRRLALRLYYPVILRIERFKAVRMWHKGVRLCQQEHERVKRPRVYLFFNIKENRWVPLVYDRRRDAVAIKQLITMGKIHVKHTPTVEEMKEECFYYTHSKWGASGSYENSLREKKLAQWISFYLVKVSVPMAKVMAFRKKLQ